MPNTFHFAPKQSREDLVLSEDYRVSGLICQYLKAFQVDAIKFLFQHFDNKESCILNDESRLGKTVDVSVFLGAVMSNKKCLIIVKDEERSLNWQFHLNLLTKLAVEVLTTEHSEILPDASVCIAKWSVLKTKAKIINQCKFDYIIIDGRDNMLVNKFCMGLLLVNYINKVSLVISSTDITSNLELFHSILRLSGRLDKNLINLKIFEQKFDLPRMTGVVANQELMEAYFMGREKIINFCRDYRLRRYKHQFEGHLPLVELEEYYKNLKIWQSQPIRMALTPSPPDSGSVQILTSSSDKDAEDLLESCFVSKTENTVNSEMRKLYELFSPIEVIASNEDYVEDDDVVVMSPLLVDDEEDNNAERKEIGEALPLKNETQHKTISKSTEENKDEGSTETVEPVPEERSAKKETPSKKKLRKRAASVTDVATPTRKLPVERQTKTAIKETKKTRITRRRADLDEDDDVIPDSQEEVQRRLQKTLKALEIDFKPKYQNATARSVQRRTKSPRKETKARKEDQKKTNLGEDKEKLAEQDKQTQLKETQKTQHLEKSLGNIEEDKPKRSDDKTEDKPKGSDDNKTKSKEIKKTRHLEKTLRDLEIDFTPKYQINVKPETTRSANRCTRAVLAQRKYIVLKELKEGVDKCSKKKRSQKKEAETEKVNEVSAENNSTQKIGNNDPQLEDDSSIENGQRFLASMPEAEEPIFKVPCKEVSPTITATEQLDIEFNLRLNEIIERNEVCFVRTEPKNAPQTIVLSSCTEDEEGNTQRKRKRKRTPKVPLPAPSPDLFSMTEDISMPCSQKPQSTFEGFKIFGSEVKQTFDPVPFGGGRSCLDILEAQFEKAMSDSPFKSKTQSAQNLPISDPDCIFEITTNNTFGSTIRINDNDEMSPIKNKFFNVSNGNKITKYFQGSNPISSTPTEITPIEVPRTPKQQKTNPSNAVKKSPRPCGSGLSNGAKSSQTTKLTQWLIKRNNNTPKPSTSSSTGSTPKRRRLDLFFK